ncbi:MAG: hypothetical protein WCC81_07260, partial [Pseudolabrys sp.]
GCTFADGGMLAAISPPAATLVAVAAPVVATGRSAVAWFVTKRLDFADSDVWKTESSIACAPCHIGFAKMATKAKTAANVATIAIRPISVDVSSSRSGGCGTGSGPPGTSDIARRSCGMRGDVGAIGAEGTKGGLAEYNCGSSRSRLGAYLLKSVSSLLLGSAMTVSLRITPGSFAAVG